MIRSNRFSLPAFLLLTACLAAEALAQQPDTLAADPVFEAALEDVDAGQGDPAQLAEWLDDLAAHPLDLNAATVEELARLPALDPLLARRIAAHRERVGLFASIEALESVEGLTEEAVTNVRPFLTVSPPRAEGLKADLRDLHFELIQRLTRRLDLGRGFADDTARTVYLGSPERLYTRLRARAGRRLSVGLTLEKDPGETFAWDPSAGSYGYDHVTGHLALRDVGRLRALIVGDFTAAFGQGMALWRSTAFGKGREPVRPLVRSGQGLAPYGSTEENRFFRGLAAAIAPTTGLTLSAFASRRTLDASVLEPDTTFEATEDLFLEAGAFTTSGLHRTPGELAKKDAVTESLAGGALELAGKWGQIGVAGYVSRFAPAFRPDPAPYRRFAFSGDAASIVSVFSSLFLGDVLFFGEAARASGGVLGGVGGLTMKAGETAEVVLLARHYPRDFVSLHGYAFGERMGATQNETGFYTGLRLHLGPRWTLAAYFDQYRFPWLRFDVPRPATGYDALLYLEHQPRRWLTVYLQARTETKEAGTTVPDDLGRLLYALRPETRQSLRLHGAYDFSRRLRLRARLEGVRSFAHSEDAQYGMLLYQDARFLLTPALQLDARLAFFDTAGFAARVFAYEDDLLYTFAVPAFSGRGQRAYLLIKALPSDRLSLQVKYAVTRFEDVVRVGSGLDETEGNRLRELRVQLRLRL